MFLTCETLGYCLYRICTVHSFFLKKIVLTLSVICPVGCLGKKESQFLTDAQVKGRTSLPQSDLGPSGPWDACVNDCHELTILHCGPSTESQVLKRFHSHENRNENRASYFQCFWMIEYVSDKEKDKEHLFSLPWTPEGTNIFWQWGRKYRTLL